MRATKRLGGVLTAVDMPADLTLPDRNEYKRTPYAPDIKLGCEDKTLRARSRRQTAGWRINVVGRQRLLTYGPAGCT